MRIPMQPHNTHLNRAKSSTVGFNLNKEGISEEMVQRSHDMFMEWRHGGQDRSVKVKLSNKDQFWICTNILKHNYFAFSP